MLPTPLRAAQAGVFDGPAKALQRKSLFVDSRGFFTSDNLVGALLQLVSMGAQVHMLFKVRAWAGGALLPLPPLPPPLAPLLPPPLAPSLLP